MRKMYFLDLDGTMYRGSKIQEGGKEFIDYLHETGQPYLFLTNNSMRSKEQNVAHMKEMGYCNIRPESFFTSAMAAALYIRKQYTQRKVWFIGEDGLKEALLEQGFILCEDEQPDFVFVGLEREADYKKYSQAIDYLLNGAILVGTNNDRILAKPTGYTIGNGAIVAMLEYASSQVSPCIGKPHEPMLKEALAYTGRTKDEIILVGDNLETDIKLGVDNQVESILVLGGVHNEEDIKRLQIYPNKTIRNLCELIDKEK